MTTALMIVQINLMLAAISFTGHVATTNIGYTDGTHLTSYTAAPNMRQGNSSTGAAKSTIAGCDATDLYVNFIFDTSGKNVYLVYTTNGTTPTKTNGTSVGATFSKYDSGSGDRTFVAQIPSSANTAGAEVRYVFYISDSTLANAWGRVAGSGGNGYGYSTSWTEGDAYFSYTARYGTSGTGSGNWSSGSTWAGGVVPNASTAEVEICNGKNVTLDAAETVKSVTINAGATLNGSSNTLTISGSGSFTKQSSGTFNADTGTIAFSGTSGEIAQVNGGPTFNNVTITRTGSGTYGVDFYAGTSRATIAGTLTINTGGYVAQESSDGAPTYGSSSTLKYNTNNAENDSFHAYEEWKGGTSGAGVPNNVELANSTWVDFTTNIADRTAGGTLTIGSGSGLILESGDSNALKVEGTVTNNGSIKQTSTLSGGSFHFANIPDKTSGTAYYGVEVTGNTGSTTVTVQGNQECSNVHSNSEPVKRCYVVDTASASSSTVRFYYRYAELRSGQNPANLKVWKYSGGTWTEVTGVTYNRSACTSGENCYVEISNYSLGDGTYLLMETNPTAAVLVGLSASAEPAGVLITWETASELGNAGFNLYRAVLSPAPAASAWMQLNPNLIPSQAIGSPVGRTYHWLDTTASSGAAYRYRLEAVGLNGQRADLDTIAVEYPAANGWRLWFARIHRR